MRRCVIVGNASIGNYDKIKEYIKDDDFMVYCDGGLKHLDKIGQEPDLIVGDFDSHENPNMDVETIVLPCEKDDTDTCHALKMCMERGFEDYLLVGCIGDRMDHTLGNVFLLLMLLEKGYRGILLDDFSEIGIVNGEETIEDKFSYFSLIAITGEAKGITIRDAKYPLENGTITPGYQYGISNEVIKGKTSKVSVKEGNLLIIKVF